MQKAELRRRQAMDRREKIEHLLLEYSRRLCALQSKDHSKAEVTNYRQFIAQLQDIHQRTDNEIKSATLECERAKSLLVVAEQERLKHQKLVKREAQRQKKEQNNVDMKMLDAQSMIQFNIDTKTH
jgi:flagellar biosynthesis chaperone FliJ